MILYKIVHKASPAALEEAVQSHIDRGWRPTGGVAYSQTTVHEGSIEWAQAMVMDVEDREDSTADW